jgi:hypothetical protein
MTLLVKCYHVVDVARISHVWSRGSRDCEVTFHDAHGCTMVGYVAAPAEDVENMRQRDAHQAHRERSA